MPLKPADKNTSQVKVVNRGHSVEYRWKRRRWQLDVRWGYLLIVCVCLAIIASGLGTAIDFAVNGNLQLNTGSFGMLVLALYSPVWISKYAKKFIEHSFETNTLEVSGRNLILTSWPFKKGRQLEASDWSQLYVSPTEELRLINSLGEHHVIASGTVADLQFLESELEQRFKIQNVQVDGEAWDLPNQAASTTPHPVIERQRSGERLKLSIRKSSIVPPSCTFAVLWLLPHYALFFKSMTASKLLLLPVAPILIPTSWIGYALLYHWWAERSNTIDFFVDKQNFQVKVGPVPSGGNFLIPMSEVSEVRFVSVTRQHAKSKQNFVEHQLEVVYGKEVRVLASSVATILFPSPIGTSTSKSSGVSMTSYQQNLEAPAVLRSLQIELNQFIKEIKAEAASTESSPPA